MEFEVVLKDNIYEQVFSLMKNIKELNDGDEIGGWLFGDWAFTNGTARLVLDEFVIPKQDVSGGEVDISPESMTDMIKEVGAEKCNRIKAHWHIHPFGKGDTSWSSIDEEKIRDFMNPDKGRELFVFLLSSEDQIKARIELNITSTIQSLGRTFSFKKSMDDVPVKREFETENGEVFNALKKRIEEKVNRKFAKSGGIWYTREKTGYKEDDKEYSVRLIESSVHVAMSQGFVEFVRECGIGSAGFMSPDKVKMKNGKCVWRYDIKNRDIKEVMKELEDELEFLYSQYTQVDYGEYSRYPSYFTGY